MKLKHVWFLIFPLLVLVGMLAWRQTAVRADAPLATQPPLDETLLEMAQSNGMVPVIVGLHMPTYAPQVADEAAQMAAIDRAQTAVLDSLAGYNIQNVKQFPYIPYMALWVDEAALLALYEMKGVTAVYEDQVSAPTAAAA